MGWFRDLATKLRPKNAAPSLLSPRYPLSDYWYLPIHLAASGYPLSHDAALQVSAVWACVEAIAKAIASCQWNIYVRERGKKRVLEDDPLAYILNVRPNPEMTAVAFKEAILFNALTHGNGYAEIGRDGAGRVATLWPLPADQVTPRRLGERERYQLVYDYTQPDGATKTLAPEDVYHVHGPGVTGLMGDCIVARAAKAVALAAAAERFADRYFENSTIIGGIIEYPKALGEDAYKRMKDSWNDAHQGSERAHGIAIMENGAKFIPHEANADKAQLLEARKFQIEEIARYYGVPPHKIGHLERATFSNIEHLGIEWVRDGLTPWALRLEQEADFKLIPSRGPYRRTKLDTAWLSYGDAKSRAEYYRIMREIGVYTVNEIREREGDNGIGADGDVRVVPVNWQTSYMLELAEQSVEQKLNEPIAAPAPTREPPETGDITEEKPTQPNPSPMKADPMRVAEESLNLLFASVFERYQKRLENRANDIASKMSAEKCKAHLSTERERLRPWLLSECEPAVELARKVTGKPLELGPEILAAIDRVDRGIKARAAAERLTTIIFKMEPAL